ncbi:MAG: hypothetical protein ACC619_08030, partial [Paracoccaceae bacterium]
VSNLLRAPGLGLAALPDFLTLGLFYALFAYVLLIVIDRCSVSTLATLMLAGAIFGWATEALIVPVSHEAPPVSWLWPAVAWHAPIDVIAGWFALRLAMRRLGAPLLTLVFVFAGVLWAWWSTWFLSETATGEAAGALAALSAAQFWGFALAAGASWIVGMILADLGATRGFRASRAEVILVGAVALVFLFFTALPFLPWSLGLMALITLTFAALARGARFQRGRAGILAPLAVAPARHTYVLAALMPLSAGLSYSLIAARDLAMPADLVIPALLLFGLAAYLWSLWRAFTARADADKPA